MNENFNPLTPGLKRPGLKFIKGRWSNFLFQKIFTAYFKLFLIEIRKFHSREN